MSTIPSSCLPEGLDKATSKRSHCTADSDCEGPCCCCCCCRCCFCCCRRAAFGVMRASGLAESLVAPPCTASAAPFSMILETADSRTVPYVRIIWAREHRTRNTATSSFKFASLWPYRGLSSISPVDETHHQHDAGVLLLCAGYRWVRTRRCCYIERRVFSSHVCFNTATQRATEGVPGTIYQYQVIDILEIRCTIKERSDIFYRTTLVLILVVSDEYSQLLLGTPW